MNNQWFKNPLAAGVLMVTVVGLAGQAGAQGTDDASGVIETRAGDGVRDGVEGRKLDPRQAEYDRIERSRGRVGEGARGPQEDQWELTLSGSGVSDKDLDSNTVGFTVDASKYFSELVSVGVRQTVSVADTPGDRAWNGATSGFGQLHFGDSDLRPFIGVELGYLYGDGVNDTFFGGPEAGVRYYVQGEAFLFARANYQFLFDSGDEVGHRFDDGRFLYTIGVGMTF